MPLLEIKNLQKYFRISRNQYLHAVDEVSLSINSNEIVGLVGESGCGKSTLGKTIVGLLDKTSGEIKFNGKPLPQKYSKTAYQEQAKEIQMIFQY